MKLAFPLCLIVVVGVVSPLPFEPPDGMLPVVAMIKGILSTDYGFQQLKTYLLNLDASDSVVQDIHRLLEQFTDEELKVTVNEFFKNVPILAIEPGFDYPKLPTLFGELKPILSTVEGLATIKAYLNKLETDDWILNQLLIELKTLDDSQLRHVVDTLFNGVKSVFLYGDSMSYSVESELKQVVGHLKRILSTPDGIKVARDFVGKIQSTNPNFILVKTILSAMSDKSLIDLVKEAAKNIPDVVVNPGDQEADLFTLVKQARDLAATDEGIKYIRLYFANFQTTNFLLARVRALLDKSTDEQIKDILIKGYDEIFGGVSYMFHDSQYSMYAADLESIFIDIKKTLSTEEGFQQLKTYLRNLVPKNPFVALGKTFFLSMSETEMKNIINDFLRKFPDTTVTPTRGLAELFGDVRIQFLTSDGLNKLRAYATGIESSNPIVLRLKAALEVVDDNTLTNIIEDIFQGVN